MRKINKTMLAYITFCAFAGNFLEEKPRSQPVNLPTKGIKGMTNAELKANKCGKISEKDGENNYKISG